MNNHTPVYRVPLLALEARQQLLYQQSTYMDRSQTAYIVQESHVSQSSFSMCMPPVQVRPTFPSAPCFGSQIPVASRSPRACMQRYPLMPNRDNVQYYAASSASMIGDGQAFVQQASMHGGYYGPIQHQQQYQQQQQYHYQQQPQQRPQLKKDNSTQTYAIVKRSCEAATQTDFVVEKKHQATNTDASNKGVYNAQMFDSGKIPAVQQNGRLNSELVLPEERLRDFTHVALMGSDIAERVAILNHQRPCFKKVDTLCGRLKQDLVRPNSVLPNINSQGIAWAVKDFIFVFTRIVHCWIILKGYIYNTPAALNKIKDELPIGFMTAFDLWQMSTLNLIYYIIMAFTNLDILLQRQKNSFSNNNENMWSSNENSSDTNSSNPTDNAADTSPRGPSAYSTPYKTGQKSGQQEYPSPRADGMPHGSNDMKYIYTMVKDSEEAQRCVNANGTYLKTGTYTPLKKDENPTELSSTPPSQQPVAALVPNIASNSNNIRNIIGPKHLDNGINAVQRQNPIMPNNPCDMGPLLYKLSGHIRQLTTIDKFFNKQFTRNYYREFYDRCQSDFIDVRTIVLKCESATYGHINQAIHDLRRIVYVISKDLEVLKQQHDQLQRHQIYTNTQHDNCVYNYCA